MLRNFSDQSMLEALYSIIDIRYLLNEQLCLQDLYLLMAVNRNLRSQTVEAIDEIFIKPDAFLELLSSFNLATLSSFIMHNEMRFKGFDNMCKDVNNHAAYACFALTTDDIKQLDIERLLSAYHYLLAKKPNVSEFLINSLLIMMKYHAVVGGMFDKHEFIQSVRNSKYHTYLNLSGIKLEDIQPDDWLSEIDFSYARLKNTDLSDCNFYKAKFNYADLSYANLMNSTFNEAELFGTNLQGAMLAPIKAEEGRINRPPYFETSLFFKEGDLSTNGFFYNFQSYLNMQVPFSALINNISCLLANQRLIITSELLEKFIANFVKMVRLDLATQAHIIKVSAYIYVLNKEANTDQAIQKAIAFMQEILLMPDHVIRSTLLSSIINHKHSTIDDKTNLLISLREHPISSNHLTNAKNTINSLINISLFKTNRQKRIDKLIEQIRPNASSDWAYDSNVNSDNYRNQSCNFM